MPPGPVLPPAVVAATQEKYREAYQVSPATHSTKHGLKRAALDSTAERAIVKEQLESLVGMMVERGILLEEAVTEFEKKFIKRVLEQPRTEISARRQSAGHPPQHAEP